MLSKERGTFYDEGNHWWPTSFTFCVYPHPWLHSGVLTARLGVLVSTLLWGLVILFVTDAWKVGEYYQLEYVASENYWGVIFALIALVQLVRTYRHSDPSFAGFMLNALMAYLWTYIALDRTLSTQLTPVAGYTSCLAIMVASWWNLVGLPKRAIWHGTKSPFIG